MSRDGKSRRAQLLPEADVTQTFIDGQGTKLITCKSKVCRPACLLSGCVVSAEISIRESFILAEKNLKARKVFDHTINAAIRILKQSQVSAK